jgi:transcriptional regulator with XRE-family HTH domain
MAERLQLLREMAGVTNKMLAGLEAYSPLENGDTDEDTPALAELKELLAARRKIIEKLNTNPAGDAGEEHLLMLKIQDLNNEVGRILNERHRELNDFLNQLRKGKRVLTYLKGYSETTGVALDQRK